jgi:hypothetical protein
MAASSSAIGRRSGRRDGTADRSVLIAEIEFLAEGTHLHGRAEQVLLVDR